MEEFKKEALREALEDTLSEFGLENQVDAVADFLGVVSDLNAIDAPNSAVKTITYSSNNSGGYWWLDDDDWRALERAGWIVDWKPERFLGALATSAKRVGVTEEQARAEFFEATRQTGYEQGCSCCGTPHWFDEED